jgi:predicted MFS family arabinose efflux permease
VRRAAVATAVAIAFADSSIVVLALPELYGRFHTSITGVSWVITAYNTAVAVTAFGLVFMRRSLLPAGLLVFFVASIGCAVAGSLAFLIAARALQGIGAALLLAGSLRVLSRRIWTLAGTFGLALGPALGGVLTQAFDWRAIFVAQAPVALLGLLGAARSRVHGEDEAPPTAGAMRANACLGLLFGALVGALFLAVLLVISVWNYSPIGGALVVSALPAAALAVRPLEARLSGAVAAGAGLLALGLTGLALLPSASVWLLVWALALCGAGLGLALPALSNAALSATATTRSAAVTVAARHVGLVLALALIAPLLASKVPAAGDRALLKGTAVLLDAPIGIDKKVPVALDLRQAFARAREGETPDLAKPFDAHGAQHDSRLAAARDRLLGAIESTITRASRSAFFVCAGFAALALLLSFPFRLVPQ